MANTTLRSILRKIVILVVTVFFAFSGFFIGLIISQFLQSNEFSFLSIFYTCSFIGISLLIAIQTHHLGHYLVGTMFHYQLISYQFDEITMIPIQRERTMTRQILYYSAGILCNLLLGIVLLLVVGLVSLELSSIGWLFFFTLGLTLVVHACIQATSYYDEEVPTDGKILWGLLFHSDFSNYYVANVNLSRAFQAGLRPSQIPMNSYREDQPLKPADYNLVLHLYYKALDLQKASIMLKYSNMLESHLSNIPEYLKDTVICELCYVSVLKGQTELAKSYFSLMKDFAGQARSMAYYRTCAYYFFYLRENPKLALSSISYALEAAPSCEFEGMRAMEQDLLQNLLLEMSDSL